MNIGGSELLLIIIITLVLFGPGKLPEIGQTIGKAVRAYREATEGLQREIREAATSTPAPSEPVKDTAQAVQESQKYEEGAG